MFESPDYFALDELLSAEHLLIRASVREWVSTKLLPIIEDCAERAEFPAQLLPQMADLGLFGPTIPEEYGGGGLDALSYGLMMQELERGDSAIRSAVSVQSSLVMFPIFSYGSAEQKQRLLPPLARGELLGCFGLTEPGQGSDPAAMSCRLRREGEELVLSGSKSWITNAPLADLAVVWAKDEAGVVRGVLVERGMEGFSTPTISKKWSLRASETGELVFDEVRIPQANILPGISGMKGPLSCLNQARFGIAWGALGAAMDCYQVALKYAKERRQFNKPLAGFQLQQKKLAEMITEITKAQLLVWRLTQLKQAGKASPAQISMGKRNNVEVAWNCAHQARQILGAMGITGEYSVMRHLMNLESVITYEGTHDIHLLITGQDVTGISAFN